MPTSGLVHNVIAKTNLPYKTFDSPTSTDPMYQAGSNFMTSLKGYAEMYPGFATALASNTFTDPQRVFIWKKWAGSYFAMYCDIVGGVATVLKQELGIDAAASTIWTDSGSGSEPFDFIDIGNQCKFGNGTDMKQYDGTTVRRWGINAPTSDPTVGTSGTGLTTYAGGFYYRTTGFNSVTGDESSPSGASACTGNIANKQVDVTWVPADYDADADYVRIYRTTDGGSTNPIQMALVAQVAVATATYADTTLDENLSATTFCPAEFRNDPPPPAKGFCKFGGRVYMFSGDKLYYTGREEISNGVPYNCVPGGADGNFERFDGEITGVQPRSSGVAVFLARKIWAFDGASLDTMYPYLLLDRRGAITRTNTYSLGNTIIWFDSAKQVWMDGEEIGKDIRPDLAALDPNNVSLAVHLSGEYHWLLVCDSASGNIWTYDLDTGQWMPPRAASAQYVYSMNTDDDSVDLLILRNQKCLKMTPGVFNDNGTTYTSYAVSNLFDMAPPSNPDFNGWLHHLGVESNSVPPTTCKILVDDDPDLATFPTTMTANAESNFLRKQGTYIRELDFMNPAYDVNSPSGKRCAFRLQWDTSGWKMYSLDVAIQPAQAVP